MNNSSSPFSARFILATPRLLLRELTPDDLDFLAETLGDPVVMRFYPRPLDREGARAWLDRQRERYSRDGHGLWLVHEKQLNVPVGQVGLVMQEVDGVREPEVGYMLHHRYWRRGYATEAACAVRDHAFSHFGYSRVISLIRPENIPSQGVARKMGMSIIRRTTHAGFEHDVHAIEDAGGG